MRIIEQMRKISDSKQPERKKKQDKIDEMHYQKCIETIKNAAEKGEYWCQTDFLVSEAVNNRLKNDGFQTTCLKFSLGLYIYWSY